MTRHWVYGLTYPEIGLFYVGYTTNMWQRFAAHWAANGDCSSYRIIRYWKGLGVKFDHVIFGEFEDAIEAKRLERALILNTSGLVNSTVPAAMLSLYLYPVDNYDGWLLAEALERADWGERGGLVDESPEYVDERYDEFVGMEDF